MHRETSDVAIIGMACVFPGSGDLESFRRNLERGVDSITTAPEERIPAEYFDPEGEGVDRLYCRRGGFVDDHAEFDALRWGLMPVAVRAAEPDQLLTLDVAARALADAGYEDRSFRRDRTGVILGRGGYLNPRMTALLQRVRTSRELVRSLERAVPGASEEEIEALRREYESQVEAIGPDTVIGIVPNLAASRIANRLDLHGPAYTIDAACASSLIAVDRAVAELADGRLDLVLSGGIHLCQDPLVWSVFNQLGALSRSQTIRPFDARADGLLMGEGVGVVVLKRLADAVRDDDRIYAVVRGTGVSSDGRGSSVMNPLSASQALAVERAWEAAGLDPTEPGVLGFLEAHGTATPSGDAAELETLARVFGPPIGDEERPGLGSVKSMIGHAMPAAGAAGLIKAALAVHRGVRYPTLHCEEPRAEIERTRFRIVSESEPWEAGDGPRRAGVNAFGFGGINAHVVLEEHRPAGRRRRRAAARAGEPALLLAAESPEALLAMLDGRTPPGLEGPCRLAVLDPSPETIERARRVVERGQRFHDRRGSIAFAPRGLLVDGGGLVFLFPGHEGALPEPLDDVAELFDLAPAGRGEGEALVETGLAVFETSRLLFAVLLELGLEPDHVAGHSIGEWSAMWASGIVPEDAVDGLVELARSDVLRVPGVAFAAVGCGADRVAASSGDRPDVHVALDNCPHQSVICGPEEDVEEVVGRLRGDGVLCQRLSFQSGFHSPLFRDYLDLHRRVIEDLPIESPRWPLWSATTCEPFPAEAGAIRELCVEHLVRPVRFRELTRRLHEAGARAFVQVGMGSLVGFVDDNLKGEPHLAISAYNARHGGMGQIRRLTAALWVEGAEPDVRRVLELVAPPGAGKRGGRATRLSLGAPLAWVRTPLGRPRPNGDDDPLAGATDPVIGEFRATMRALEESQRAILDAWRRRRGEPRGLGPRREVREVVFSLERQPYLRDHSFFALPEGWPDPSDAFPLVPMTMTISRMIDAARDLVPERTVVGVRDVRAYRWVSVEEPVTVPIEARFDGEAEVSVRVGDYARGVVRLAEGYPSPPEPAADGSLDAGPVPVTAEEMYERRMMFHGPAYRAVRSLDSMGEDGIRGRLVRLPAEGSLLDAAGQLLGLWILLNSEENRVSAPVMVESATFYGADPPVDAELDCEVRIRRFGHNQVRADIDLLDGGRVWARIEGWEDRRPDTDRRMFSVILEPDCNLLAPPDPVVPGACRLEPLIERAFLRDYFARCYLDGREIAEFRALPHARKGAWLGTRIVCKDAARQWLWSRGEGPIFPIEIRVEEAPGGGLRLRHARGVDLRVSAAVAEGVAIALVDEGGPVGIGLAPIEGADEGADPLTDAEIALLPESGGDEWKARFRAARGAAARARGDDGAEAPGGPRVTAVEGESVVVDGIRVRTGRAGEHAVAWTTIEMEG